MASSIGPIGKYLCRSCNIQSEEFTFSHIWTLPNFTNARTPQELTEVAPFFTNSINKDSPSGYVWISLLITDPLVVEGELKSITYHLLDRGGVEIFTPKTVASRIKKHIDVLHQDSKYSPAKKRPNLAPDSPKSITY